MDLLFEKQDAMLNATSMEIVRNFMGHVNWDAPMLCIRGPRGVGKSTLLRQHIIQRYGIGSETVLYCSLDFAYFTQHSILEVAEKFYKHGGQLLVLDEVHKYENWSREVKEDDSKWVFLAETDGWRCRPLAPLSRVLHARTLFQGVSSVLQGHKITLLSVGNLACGLKNNSR